jgi:hypothetical protein
MSGNNNSIRVSASGYAKTFLANKYHKEYRELYRAYLINRGISVRGTSAIVDERQLLTESGDE